MCGLSLAAVPKAAHVFDCWAEEPDLSTVLALLFRRIVRAAQRLYR